MTDTQQIKLIKSRADTISGGIATVASIIIVYYSMNPDTLNRHRQLARSLWTGVTYRISVWQAAAAIRSLPETHERAS